MPKICELCKTATAKIKRPKNQQLLCHACFFLSFEEEIHYTLVSNKVFHKGEKVCIAISGGKDSTVLAHVIKTLNDKYGYGLDLFFLAIDEGIKGYRDDSIKTVKRN
jgi:cytoplasmic tRNA 2-thiolation protein 1